MQTEQDLFSIEHFDIFDNGSQEIEVKCSQCGEESTFPFMTLIRREKGNCSATYREFCSHHCFIDWLLFMAPRLKELRDDVNSRRANTPDVEETLDAEECPTEPESSSTED